MRRWVFIFVWLLIVPSYATNCTYWVTRESRHFLIYYSQDYLLEAEIDQIVEEAEGAYEFVTGFLNMEPKKKTPIYLYASAVGYGEFFSGGRAEIGEIYVNCKSGKYDSCRNASSDESFGSLIAHELTHIVMSSEGKHPTALLTEGIAEYVDTKYVDGSPHWGAKFFLENGALIPLKKIIEYFIPYYPLGVYQEGSSFCAFLIEEYGIDKYKEFYFKEIENPDNSFEIFGKDAEQIYSMPISELEDEWIKKLEALPSTNTFYEGLASFNMNYNRVGGEYRSLTQGGMTSVSIEGLFDDFWIIYQNDIREAKKILIEVERMMKEENRGMEIYMSAVIALQQAGDLERAKKDFDQAAAFFSKSGFMSLRNECEDYMEAIVFTQEGDASLESDPSSALRAYEEALGKYEKLNNPLMKSTMQEKIEEARQKIPQGKTKAVLYSVLVIIALIGVILMWRICLSWKIKKMRNIP